MLNGATLNWRFSTFTCGSILKNLRCLWAHKSLYLVPQYCRQSFRHSSSPAPKKPTQKTIIIFCSPKHSNEIIFQTFISLAFGNVLVFIQTGFLSSLYWFFSRTSTTFESNLLLFTSWFLPHFQKENSYCYSSFCGLKRPSLSHSISH